MKGWMCLDICTLPLWIFLQNKQLKKKNISDILFFHFCLKFIIKQFPIKKLLYTQSAFLLLKEQFAVYMWKHVTTTIVIVLKKTFTFTPFKSI